MGSLTPVAATVVVRVVGLRARAQRRPSEIMWPRTGCAGSERRDPERADALRRARPRHDDLGRVLLSDGEVISGGSDPTGTVTFVLTDPAKIVDYVDVVPVSGDGTYSTGAGDNPSGVLSTTAGTFQWQAT